MWLLFGLALLLRIDPKANLALGIVISSVVALAMAFIVWKKIQPAQCEIRYSEKAAFINHMNSQLEGLGFKAKSVKDNKFKYRAFIWFSLIDPKINIRLKDKKAIIKGRKEDLDNLLSKLNTQKAA
jgi:hypothetical protein